MPFVHGTLAGNTQSPAGCLQTNHPAYAFSLRGQPCSLLLLCMRVHVLGKPANCAWQRDAVVVQTFGEVPATQAVG